MCVFVCVCACVCACVRVCVRVSVRACVHIVDMTMTVTPGLPYNLIGSQTR